MNTSRVTAIAAVCAVAAGGTGAAVAATGNSDSGSSSTTKSANCAGPGKGWGMHRGGPLNDVAAALGIKVSSLQSQLKAGKKLSEIATAQGKTLDEVKAAVKASLKTKLDKAVTAGKITQTQADEQLSRVDTLIDNIEAGKKPPIGKGHGGGPGGPEFGGPGFGGARPSGSPPSSY
jgi:hypothetical protein